MFKFDCGLIRLNDKLLVDYSFMVIDVPQETAFEEVQFFEVSGHLNHCLPDLTQVLLFRLEFGVHEILGVDILLFSSFT